ncbi:hypothetical protein QQM39_45395 [Streptomyces sp. DT2A-34]|uniref:hypothetical protein n=1 Tax=Streptomyces sp. DT2A-34 TaxID=3051182 RepID=UPI00265C6F5F|nr:hypothetical protein [Streptomyces sp. DT2A-34]MDO0917764.1 hypothetical protein [Streptomyces sp. DT2A-34]
MTFPVTSLWETPVWSGALAAEDLAGLPDLLGSDPEVRAACTKRLGQALTDVAHTLAGPGAREPDTPWSAHTERWEAGYHCGLRYGKGTLQAIVVVSATGTARHAESGRISLHDPRAGASNVFLPGLPWGRHHHLEPEPGNVLICPSWVAWSVAPVQDGHTVEVCLLHSTWAAGTYRTGLLLGQKLSG